MERMKHKIIHWILFLLWTGESGVLAVVANDQHASGTLVTLVVAYGVLAYFTGSTSSDA